MLDRVLIFPIIVPLVGVAALGVIAGAGDDALKLCSCLMVAVFFAAVLRAQRASHSHPVIPPTDLFP